MQKFISINGTIHFRAAQMLYDKFEINNSSMVDSAIIKQAKEVLKKINYELQTSSSQNSY